MTSSLPPGLRERKKAKTRAAIRDQAMRLFEEQGYAATTIDQIAEAAEVSQSTFFRYFPTKEDIVLTDDYDPMIADAVRSQPPEVPPVDALLTGMKAVFARLSDEDWASERRRQRLIQTVPELRARSMQQTLRVMDMLADVIAEREGRPSGDLSSRVIAGALVGVVMAIMPPESALRSEPFDVGRLEEALTLLQRHLTLR